MKLYNSKNHFDPRNVRKYNNLYKDKRNLKYTLFHLELKQCLHLKEEMKKDYLNYEVVMCKLQEQYDFHFNKMRRLLKN